MTANRNAVPSYSLSVEDQELMFQRNIEHLRQERDQRYRKAEWPLLINQLLHAHAGKVQAQEAEIAGFHAGQG